MKTKLFLLSLMAIVLASCKPVEPDTIVSAKSCLEDYLNYYPYSLNEKFIFVNEDLNRRWEGEAYNRKGDKSYPETHILCNNNQENGEPNENYGNWNSTIHASILEKGISPTHDEPSCIATYIDYVAGSNMGKPITISWNFSFRLSDEEIYHGELLNSCTESEMSSMLTDTIVVPMLYQRGNSIIALPEGSYALIIKRKGLTEFSVDGGQTVWKRIKE